MELEEMVVVESAVFSLVMVVMVRLILVVAVVVVVAPVEPPHYLQEQVEVVLLSLECLPRNTQEP
tara:strand:- start:26 stop:220 length:195 start_codon:yes stop_codon:yes gene_type:complete